ncbi:MAG: hypothetical protein OXE59_12990 [Bacteroidetes bacterium]|nr:hypothetical protein [Bacteroidota bacterium]MCY4234639.1 hypothetical protein [Bacteroidota bacterium]
MKYLIYPALSLLIAISSCSDVSVNNEIIPEYKSLDTPEAYFVAIAEAHTNLLNHTFGVVRDMDEEEFEEVMFDLKKTLVNVEVLQNSPIFDPTLPADSRAKKFSEGDYRSWESNRSNYLDALSPIIPKEEMVKFGELITEFFTVYDASDIDTTGFRAIMQKASQDALAKKTENFSCGNPDKIKVNHASVVPSTDTIMGWFPSNEIQQASCSSCCIQCCGCLADCDQETYDAIGNSFYHGLIFAGSCIAYSWWLGPITWSACGYGSLVTVELSLLNTLYESFRCVRRCKNRDDCQMCPAGYTEYSSGISCSTAHTW